MAVLASLCAYTHLIDGFTNRTLRTRIAGLIPDYSARQMTYDLRRKALIRRVPRSQWGDVPSTLVNPAVGFSQAVLSWDGRSVGVLDEQRIFAALCGLGA